MRDIAFQYPPVLSRFFSMAIVAGVESAVQIHIDRGDDLNARDNKGQTPLMLSAARNKAAICRLLIAAGADASLLDPLGRNALAIAQAAEAFEAATVIDAACSPKSASLDDDSFYESVPAVRHEHSLPGSSGPQAIHFADAAPEQLVDESFPTPEPEAVSMPIVAWAFIDDGDGFDLAGWEAEEDQLPPESDPTIYAAAFGIQSAITEVRIHPPSG